MGAWNGWWHVNGNTYGTWLRGDPRGWRARHHREHVEGDYKNPPPDGQYEQLHRRSRRLMKRPPVRLSPEASEIACREIAASLKRHGVSVIAVSVDDHHFHLLAKFPDAQQPLPMGVSRRDAKTALGLVRHMVGMAKKDSARAVSDAGVVETGGIWAVRARCLPVKDRSHQVNVYRYIVGHGSRRAAVWTYRDG